MEENIKGLHVLIVEDNILNQKFAAAVVKKMGYKADIVANGLLGLEAYKTKKYDLILMDIQMPVMNGIEATKAIRRIELEEGKDEHIPIIAVTAFAMEQDRKNCMEAGMDAFLAKPYKPFELQQTIEKILT